MSTMPSSPDDAPAAGLWRELAAVLALTALTLAISVHWQWSEGLFALTRHWEWLQADELPIGLLALSIGLLWIAWRRYRQARRELAGRRLAEARLAALLEQYRRLAQQNLEIEETERKHLARELHDELGQYLNAIKLDAVAIRDSHGEDAPLACRSAAAIVRSVDHVHRAVSGMIARLRPVGLDELGLKAALEHLVAHWREREPAVEVNLKLTGDLEGLDESTNLTVYRLIQEALTNVRRHARARQVEVALERCDAQLRLTVADDGCGMDPGARSGRFGLHGMRERVEMAGGSFEIDSAPGRGTRLAACWPLAGSLAVARAAAPARA